ncbi:MAG: response regulator transcription factor [Solirubrobacterales bacterium]
MIRVLVVDDHPVVRAGLEAVLRAEPGIVPIGAAVGPHDALALVRRARPDVVLLDVHLGPHNGLDVCRQLRSEPRPPAVLIISANVDGDLDIAARAAGARGAVDKSTDLHALFEAIRVAARPAQAA